MVMGYLDKLLLEHENEVRSGYNTKMFAYLFNGDRRKSSLCVLTF